MFELRRMMLQWLVARLQSAAPPPRRVQRHTMQAPRVDGGHVDGAEGGKRVRRQSNLATRPGETGWHLGERPLGDGTRHRAPVEPRRGGLGVPPGFYPFDPPAAPTPPGRSWGYDGDQGLWRVWGDPLQRYLSLYGGAVNRWPAADALLDTPGNNVPTPFALEEINGARQSVGVKLPWVGNAPYLPQLNPSGRNLNAYANLLDESFNGVPLPVVGNEVLCYVGVGTDTNESGDPYVEATRYQDEAADYAAHLWDAPEGAASEAGFTVPLLRDRVAIDAMNSPPSPVYSFGVYFFWWGDDLEGGELDTGELQITFMMQVYGEAEDGVEWFATSSDSTTGKTRQDASDEANRMARWGYVDTIDGYRRDLVVRAPRPATGEWGSYTVREEYDSDFDEYDYYVTRDYVAGGGGMVYGNVVANSAYEAATGEPIPGLNSGWDVVGGAYRIERPYDGNYQLHAYDVMSTSDIDNLRALATARPVMYQSSLGTMPRPYADHIGAWAGIDYEAVGTPGAEVMVSCDALVDRYGVTWGVVLQQALDSTEPTLTVSRKGEAVWSGPLSAVVPRQSLDSPYITSGLFDGDSYRAFPHQRFDHPGWPHRQAAVGLFNAIASEPVTPSRFVFLRPRLPHERWTGCPLVAVDEPQP